MTARRASRLDRVGKVALAVWGPVALTVTAFLMVNHVVSMPLPSDRARLVEGVRSMHDQATPTFLLHVIFADCSCTDSLFAHLMERGAPRDREELILYVGEDRVRAAQARAEGFRFETTTPAALRNRLGLAAAPLLVISRSGSLEYVGGYYAQPATVRPQDQELLARVVRGAHPAALPLYGCAVDPDLQAALDPLGIRYLRASR